MDAQVSAVRLLVMDPDGRIEEVWTNSTDPVLPRTAFRVRASGPGGADQPLTDAVWNNYLALPGTIDWSAKGKVYDRDDLADESSVAVDPVRPLSIP